MIACLFFFFFNDTATTEIYTLSLHDALPIYSFGVGDFGDLRMMVDYVEKSGQRVLQILPINDSTITHTWSDSYPYRDRKSTRLNSSHANISYAVFCLKKKNTYITYLLTTQIK